MLFACRKNSKRRRIRTDDKGAEENQSTDEFKWGDEGAAVVDKAVLFNQGDLILWNMVFNFLLKIPERTTNEYVER